MRHFRYGRDPLTLVAIGLYAINRWALKPHLHGGFLHDHFNDVLLIPAALPLILWVQRRLGWRTHDAPPTGAEVALHLVVWTVLCEGIGPHLVARATGDWRDALAYLAGAMVSWCWWHRSAMTEASWRSRRRNEH